MRQLTPHNFKIDLHSANRPLLTLTNPSSHTFCVHPISPNVVRITHSLPTSSPRTTRPIVYETPDATFVPTLNVLPPGTAADIRTGPLRVRVSWSDSPKLEWYYEERLTGGPDEGDTGDTLETANDAIGPAVTATTIVDEGSSVADRTPFASDIKMRAYAYDNESGSVWHYTKREMYLPLHEDEDPSAPVYGVPAERDEYVYGLGETAGPLCKNGKSYKLEARDSLAYGFDGGAPLYKVTPFYTVYKKSSDLWYGMYYNNLTDTTFDFGAEVDVIWGSFRTYCASSGPLDYYLILGPTLPDVLTSYAALTSPTPTLPHPISASAVLPPLSQFGYLASSLALAEEKNAANSIVEFVRRNREEGFPIDALYLSSGWCQNEETGNREYWIWNTARYPSPKQFGRTLENELGVQLIANVKPWLLDSHPFYEEVASLSGFVRAAPDAEGDPRRMGPEGQAKHHLWSSGFGCYDSGSALDFSSAAAQSWWGVVIRESLLENNVTGVWDDNNEFSYLLDTEEGYIGESGPWSSAVFPAQHATLEGRLGWRGGPTRVGAVGRAVQTAGMNKATFDALLEAAPDRRPVVVSRSAVPGSQAFAHASWSGDNATSWKALRASIAMTLSTGISFGPGLWGHDIGGFAGQHSPSPELLVRWCQHGLFHTRFTVHSWKTISTTLFMYPSVTAILRSILVFRYRLAPSLYSLYITQYHRRGHPVLRPLLWHHARSDSATLLMDEEFLFGSHVLVAPVTIKGARSRKFYLPGGADDLGVEEPAWWCEWDTGFWHAPMEGNGQIVELDAPLERLLILVRAGGILLLGGACERTIRDGRSSRYAFIFPPPHSAHNRTSSGRFTLIEDDGESNAHTTSGAYAELEVSFAVAGDGEEVQVAVDVVHAGWKEVEWQVIWFVLPARDNRRMKARNGDVGREGVWEEDGRKMLGLSVRF